MMSALGLALMLTLPCQVLVAPPFSEDATVRLAYMKDSVTPYNVHSLGGDATSFQLQPEPIFRLTNAVSGVKDGAIFLWRDGVGRPEAAIQVFRIPSGAWLHEFTSLSTAPLIAESHSNATWQPSKPGVEFRPVPDAPRPAESSDQRIRQLHALAQDFAADDHFETKSWNALRLLPKPLLRYGKAGSKVEDGALFSFVLGTDPEVFLMLEARPGKGGPEWQYAFAPMTCYPVKGSWKGRQTWSLPLRLPAKDSGEPFFDMEYSRESK